MGYEIHRVPLDFDWPIGVTWLSFSVHVAFPGCPDCQVDPQNPRRDMYESGDGWGPEALRVKRDLFFGAIPWPEGIGRWDGYRAIREVLGVSDDNPIEGYYCQRCGGEGRLSTPELKAWAEAQPKTPIPQGPGWQLWETVGDSPLSPVFETDTELIDWMTTNPSMVSGRFSGLSRIPFERHVAENLVRSGWAPTMIGNGQEIEDGAVWLAEHQNPGEEQ